MNSLPDGKLLVYIVDFAGMDADVADRLAEKLQAESYMCSAYPGQRKYKVYWNLDHSIAEVIGCPAEMVHLLK